MAKKWPPRPEEDTWITSLQSQLDIEANFRRAGFAPVDEAVVRRRFWQLLDFLNRHDYLTPPIADTMADVHLCAELRTGHLTDAGFRFVQRYGDRWIGRMHTDTGAAKEEKFLEKWHRQLA